jgi:Tol biopolymer transport system component
MRSRAAASIALAAILTSSCATAAPPQGTLRPSVSQTAGPSVAPSIRPSKSPTPSVSMPAPIDLAGRIYFARAGGTYGDESIFTANANGTQEARLTEPSAFCCQRIAPDRSRLLVIREPLPGEPLRSGVLNPDDGSFDAFPIASEGLSLAAQAWSPDGKRIAFEGWDDADPSRNGVYTASYPDLGDLERLSETPFHDIPVDWSPDGTMLVFFRQSHAEPWDQGGSLWIANVDGSGIRELAMTEPSPNWWARFSPDGSKLLFGSARLQEAGALWTIQPDGTNLTKLFEDSEGRFPITPAWSPDGSRIMFALEPINDEFRHLPNEVYVIDADGGGLTFVFGGVNAKRHFEWVE